MEVAKTIPIKGSDRWSSTEGDYSLLLEEGSWGFWEDRSISGNHHIRVGPGAHLNYVKVSSGGEGKVTIVVEEEGVVEFLNLEKLAQGQSLWNGEVFLKGDRAKFSGIQLWEGRGTVLGEGAVTLVHEGQETQGFWASGQMSMEGARGKRRVLSRVLSHSQRTKTHQIMRSFLDEQGSGVLTMEPFLQVETDDVLEARHGASSYALNEEELFYFQSRGWSRKEAEKWLKSVFWSFFQGYMFPWGRDFCTQEGWLL